MAGKLYQELAKWQNGDIQEGDVFRHWLFCNAQGHVSHRFQLLSRGNYCRINANQIREDYKEQNVWGQSWNNACSMPLPAIRVVGQKVIKISLAAALAAIA